MPIITREAPNTPEAVALIGELDSYLQPFYPPQSQHGYSVEKLIAEGVAFFVIRENGAAAGCGAIKLYDDYGELKRMYVRPAFRGLGLAKRLIEHLAAYAQSHDVRVLRLETGIYQHEAIALYEKLGFVQIPPFGEYWDDPLSYCYEKQL